MSSLAPSRATAPRLLVVDSNPGSLFALAELLRDEDFDVLTAQDASSARALAVGSHPDLALIDAQIQGMGGVELVEQIRRSGAALPVLLMTARRLQTLQRHAQRLGGVDILDKPLDFTKVLHQIHNVLATRRGRGGGSMSPPDRTTLRPRAGRFPSQLHQ